VSRHSLEFLFFASLLDVTYYPDVFFALYFSYYFVLCGLGLLLLLVSKYLYHVLYSSNLHNVISSDSLWTSSPNVLCRYTKEFVPVPRLVVGAFPSLLLARVILRFSLMVFVSFWIGLGQLCKSVVYSSYRVPLSCCMVVLGSSLPSEGYLIYHIEFYIGF
jgi:hypothetical protein